MANICKPCNAKVLDEKPTCKPISFCVGNYVFKWDGKCPILIERQYKIPDGTYTSITFEDGCIVNVGQAPLSQYTPQACCGGQDDEQGNTNNTLNISSMTGNIAEITNNELFVKPYFSQNSTVKVKGDGTVDKPFVLDVPISKSSGNALSLLTDGLYSSVVFKASDNVKVTGKGTAREPYVFEVESQKATLPELNKEVVVGNGFEVTKTGLFKADPDLQLVTNLTFDNDAFSVVNSGEKTTVFVNSHKLRTGGDLKTNGGIAGVGVTGDELRLDLNAILDMIAADDQLKGKLKQIIEG